MKVIVECPGGRTTAVDVSDKYIAITENGIIIFREFCAVQTWTRDQKPKKVTVIWE